MAPLKAGFFLVAALGSTYAVREVTTGYIVPTYFAGPAADQPAPAPPPAAGETPQSKAAIKELSQAEMEEELKRAQEAIATGQAPKPGKSGELEEFLPTKPLPADLPVGLPSDI